MTTLKSLPTIVIIGILVALGQTVCAQLLIDNRLPDTTAPDSTNFMAVVASYRDDVRQSVLRVSQYPQVLMQLAQQQVHSQQIFEAYMQQYGKTRQGWFYDIARYPGILHALAILPRKEKAQGRAITQTLPVESQRSAWKLYRHHQDYLARIDTVNQQAEQLFESLVTPLGIATQKSFRQLLTLPDLLGLLTQQIPQMTQLRQSYQTDSLGTAQQLTILHDSLIAQNRRELATYQRELSQDPLAQQELLLAGQDYALDNSLTKRVNPDSVWADSSAYYQNPYSYWFGYPSWYSAPLWYPSTGLYDTGIGYGPNGYLTVFSFPSLRFTNWFFTRGFRSYPHLCDRFNAYYDQTTSRHRYWTPRNSSFLLAAHSYAGSRYNDWNSRSNWLTRPRHYYHTTNVTGSNVNIWTSSSRSHYTRPSHLYHSSSRSWGSSTTHTHSSSSGSHHSSSSHSHSSGGYHGGSSHSRGPR